MASKQLLLKVTNTPAQNLVPSNYVFVSESLFKNQATYLKINGCVFIAQPHAKIPDESIGLNKLQRAAAHASPDRPAPCEVFIVPKHNFAIEKITFGTFVGITAINSILYFTLLIIIYYITMFIVQFT